MPPSRSSPKGTASAASASAGPSQRTSSSPWQSDLSDSSAPANPSGLAPRLQRNLEEQQRHAAQKEERDKERLYQQERRDKEKQQQRDKKKQQQRENKPLNKLKAKDKVKLYDELTTKCDVLQQEVNRLKKENLDESESMLITLQEENSRLKQKVFCYDELSAKCQDLQEENDRLKQNTSQSDQLSARCRSLQADNSRLSYLVYHLHQSWVSSQPLQQQLQHWQQQTKHWQEQSQSLYQANKGLHQVNQGLHQLIGRTQQTWLSQFDLQQPAERTISGLVNDIRAMDTSRSASSSSAGYPVTPDSAVSVEGMRPLGVPLLPAALPRPSVLAGPSRGEDLYKGAGRTAADQMVPEDNFPELDLAGGRQANMPGRAAPDGRLKDIDDQAVTEQCGPSQNSIIPASTLAPNSVTPRFRWNILATSQLAQAGIVEMWEDGQHPPPARPTIVPHDIPLPSSSDSE